MTDHTDVLDDIPIAEIERKTLFSFIWFIPLVALLIGGWLIYKVNSEKGEIVVVTFNNAEGIEAKKTPVRYKDVDVGRVKNVELDEDLRRVKVYIQLNKQMSEYLGPDTRFWVFRPRISINEVSGLSTLLSGIYISMDPGKPGDDKDVYEGLETPPRVTTYSKGRSYVLQADKLGSLDVGSPVYYRQIRVGEVIKYELNADRDTVDITLFINSPYDKLVLANSRFWNISGLDLEVTSEGLSAKMESLTSLLVGGITFETPHNLQVRMPVTKNTVFPLYSSEKAANEKGKGDRIFYVMHFDGSLKGLSIGSNLEYRGIPVGKVEDIQLIIDSDFDDIKIPVLVSVYADQFSVFGDGDDAHDTLISMVEKGLRAQLKSSSLLTGGKHISLEVPDDPDIEPGNIIESEDTELSYAEFPTMPGFTQQLTRSATDIVEQVELAIKDIRNLVNSPDIKSSTQDIARILQDTQSLLAEIKPDIAQSAKMVSGTISNANDLITQTKPDIVDTMKMVKGTVGNVNDLVSKTKPEIVDTMKMVKGTVGNVNDLVTKSKPEIVSTISMVKGTVGNANDLISKSKPEVVRSLQTVRQLLTQSNSLVAEVKDDVVETAKYLKGTMHNAQALTAQVNREVMPVSNQVKKTLMSLEKTLGVAQRTLHNTNAVLGEDSAMQYEIRQLIEEVTEAANAFSVLADTLQRQPSSVVFGK